MQVQSKWHEWKFEFLIAVVTLSTFSIVILVIIVICVSSLPVLFIVCLLAFRLMFASLFWSIFSSWSSSGIIMTCIMASCNWSLPGVRPSLFLRGRWPLTLWMSLRYLSFIWKTSDIKKLKNLLARITLSLSSPQIESDIIIWRQKTIVKQTSYADDTCCK